MAIKHILFLLTVFVLYVPLGCIDTRPWHVNDDAWYSHPHDRWVNDPNIGAYIMTSWTGTTAPGVLYNYDSAVIDAIILKDFAGPIDYDMPWLTAATKAKSDRMTRMEWLVEGEGAMLIDPALLP